MEGATEGTAPSDRGQSPIRRDCPPCVRLSEYSE